MNSSTIRISKKSQYILKKLSGRQDKSMQKVLDEAIELYRRKSFLEDINIAYSSILNDKELREEMRKENAEWDVTLMDGLDDGN